MILVLRFGGLGCFGLCGWVVGVWVVFGDCCCLRRWTLLRLWFGVIVYVCGVLDFFRCWGVCVGFGCFGDLRLDYCGLVFGACLF